MDYDARGCRVRTQIGERGDAQREHAPGTIERKLRLAGQIAAMTGREKFFHTLGAPLDRALQSTSTESEHDVFRIEARLHPEAAADVTHQYANFVVWDTEHHIA